MRELSVYYRAYREYQDRMQQDAAHTALMKALLADTNASEGFQAKVSQCRWDEDWINAMLEALPYVERAVAEQRKFIVAHEEIRRIDQAKKISVESVRHLAQHSNMISNVDGDEIIPDRVLIVERDDNYLIYENRFLYTLILKMESFLNERFNAVAELNQAVVQSVFINRGATWNRKHLEAAIRLDFEQRPTKLRGDVDPCEMTAEERVGYLQGHIADLKDVPLMRLLKGATQVSMPIVRTNVFKKNVNFKCALELYEYLENYHKAGYEILCTAPETQCLDAHFRRDMCEGIAFESFLLRLNAQPELRLQLEEIYQQENEITEQERIRQEEERECAVQARIAQARAEEIAIRELEIAKHEETIGALRTEVENKQNKILDLNAELADTRKLHAEERKAVQQAHMQELAHVRSECEASMKKIRCERDKLKDALDAEAKRIQTECAKRLEEQRNALETKFEGCLSRKRLNMQRQLERQEKIWNVRMRKQREDFERKQRKTLQNQQEQHDKEVDALERDLEKYKSKLKILEEQRTPREVNERFRLSKFLKR